MNQGGDFVSVSSLDRSSGNPDAEARNRPQTGRIARRSVLLCCRAILAASSWTPLSPNPALATFRWRQPPSSRFDEDGRSDRTRTCISRLSSPKTSA